MGPGTREVHDEVVPSVVRDGAPDQGELPPEREGVTARAGYFRYRVETGRVFHRDPFAVTLDVDATVGEVDAGDVSDPGVLHRVEKDEVPGMVFVARPAVEMGLRPQVLDAHLGDAFRERVLVDPAAAELLFDGVH